MANSWDNWSKKELLELPFKKPLTGGDYSNILILPTRKKLYPKGTRNYVILIGCVNFIPVEIICFSEEFKSGELYKLDGTKDLESIELSFAVSSKGVMSFASKFYLITVPINLTTMTEFVFSKKKGQY